MSATHGSSGAIARVYAPPIAALASSGSSRPAHSRGRDALGRGLSAVLLLGSVFAAVHHAEVVALKVGEPFGSVLLALAVTVIEASLIVTAMLSGGATENALARDSVFAAVAIVLNGVVGICLLVGGARYREQGFRVEGTASALSVLATLAVLTLVMPNYTLAKLGPQYSPTQLVFVSTLALLLYFVFVFVQSVQPPRIFFARGVERHRLGEEPDPPSAGQTAAARYAGRVAARGGAAGRNAVEFDRARHPRRAPAAVLPRRRDRELSFCCPKASRRSKPRRRTGSRPASTSRSARRSPASA